MKKRQGDLSDSPLSFVAEEVGRPSAFGEGLKRAIVHEPARFLLDTKKAKGGLKVDVSGPNYKAKHGTNKRNDGTLEIHFTPIEVGYHMVAVSWNNKSISGESQLCIVYLARSWKPSVPIRSL